MMRQICILSIFVCLSLPVYSQNQVRDSLLNVIRTNTDTIKVRALYDLARKSRLENPELADSLYNSGIDYSEKIGDNRGEFFGYTGKGITAAMKGNYPEAIIQFTKAMEVSRKYKMKDNEASTLNNLGIVYKRLGDYPRSVELYKKSLDINFSIEDFSGISAVYDNLGILSNLMEETEQAKFYFKQSLFYNRKLHGREEFLEITYQNLAVVFRKEKSYDSALYYLMKSREVLDLIEEGQHSSEYVDLYINLGRLHMDIGDLNKAEEDLNEALLLLEQKHIPDKKSSVLYSMAEIAIKKGQLNQALTYGLMCDSAAMNSNMNVRISASKEILSRIYEEMGLFHQSLEYRKLYQSYSDSILNEQKVRDYENHKVILEVSEKDRQLKLQELELSLLESNLGREEQWRWGLFFILSLSGISLLLVFQKYTNRKQVNLDLQKKNEIISIQNKEIESMNQELEKKMLRAQLNPHFIFNALNSIQHFITDNNRTSALKYLSKFSSLLRQILESSINLKLVLEEDIRMLTIYLELEALRFDHAFHFEIIVDDTIDKFNFEMPAMILQPFVENAIIHGLMNKEGEKNLEIRFIDQENSVKCCVIDNGIGRVRAGILKEINEKSRNSRGLEVIKKRLLSHNGESKAEPFEFTDFYDDQGIATGTRVCITINK